MTVYWASVTDLEFGLFHFHLRQDIWHHNGHALALKFFFADTLQNLGIMSLTLTPAGFFNT